MQTSRIIKLFVFIASCFLTTFAFAVNGGIIGGTADISAPTNATQGSTIPVETNLAITYNGSNTCVFTFLYSLDGTPVTNTTQTLDVPFNGSAGLVNMSLPDAGMINASVAVGVMNCSISGTLGGTSSGLINVIAAMATAPIPTLGQWGLFILGALVIIVSIVSIRSEVLSSKSAF